MSDNNIPNVDNVIPLQEQESKKIPTTAKEFIEEINNLLPSDYWYSPTDQKIYLSTGKKDLTLCSPFAVIARTQNMDRVGGGLLLGFIDMDGDFRKIAVPRTIAAGDFKNLAELLFNQEMPYISTSSTERRLMMEAILLSNPKNIVKFVSKTGWVTHDYSFALPNNIINGDGSVVYQTTNPKSSPQRVSGTVESWHETIGKYCVNNPPMMLAAATAVSSCIADLLNHDGCMFGIYAPSSTGKSTSSGIYSSIIGYNKDSWKTTDNAAESLLESRNGIGIVFDDMSQASPAAATQIPYMIGNGGGKSRADISGEAKASKTFTVNAFSTAEKSVNEFMNETLKRDSMGGVDVRFIQGKSDVFKYKCFNDIHGFSSAGAFADYINDVCSTESSKFEPENSGIVLNTVIQSLSNDVRKNPEFRQELKDKIKEFKEKLIKSLPQNASPQVARVAGKYALLIVAGEYACQCNAFLFNFDQMRKGLWSWWKNCYLESRDSLEQKEESGTFTKFIDFMVVKHAKYFAKVDIAGGFQPQNTTNECYGYYDEKAGRFYINPTGMKEICGSPSQVKTVCTELRKKDLLETGKNGSNEVNQIQKRITGTGKSKKFYSISDDILSN